MEPFQGAQTPLSAIAGAQQYAQQRHIQTQQAVSDTFQNLIAKNMPQDTAAKLAPLLHGMPANFMESAGPFPHEGTDPLGRIASAQIAANEKGQLGTEQLRQKGISDYGQFVRRLVIEGQMTPEHAMGFGHAVFPQLRPEDFQKVDPFLGTQSMPPAGPAPSSQGAPLASPPTNNGGPSETRAPGAPAPSPDISQVKPLPPGAPNPLSTGGATAPIAPPSPDLSDPNKMASYMLSTGKPLAPGQPASSGGPAAPGVPSWMTRPVTTPAMKIAAGRNDTQRYGIDRRTHLGEDQIQAAADRSRLNGILTLFGRAIQGATGAGQDAGQFYNSNAVPVGQSAGLPVSAVPPAMGPPAPNVRTMSQDAIANSRDQLLARLANQKSDDYHYHTDVQAAAQKYRTDMDFRRQVMADQNHLDVQRIKGAADAQGDAEARMNDTDYRTIQNLWRRKDALQRKLDSAAVDTRTAGRTNLGNLQDQMKGIQLAIDGLYGKYQNAQPSTPPTGGAIPFFPLPHAAPGALPPASPVYVTPPAARRPYKTDVNFGTGR